MKRQILWLALIPLMAFWMWTISIYSPTPYASNPILPLILVIIGVLLAWVGLSKIDVKIGKESKLLVIPLILSCLIIPYPYSLGLAIVALALIASLLPGAKAFLGLLISGMILVGQTLIIAIYYLLAPNAHFVPWVSYILSFLLNLTGLRSSPENEFLYISGAGQIFPFTVTFEKLGLYPWILIMIGSFIIILINQKGSKQILKDLFLASTIGILYLIIRFIFLVQVFFSTDITQISFSKINVFIDPIWLLFSFVPLVLIFFIIIPISIDKVDFKISFNRRQVLGLVVLSLAALFLTSSLTYQDPGIKKSGRILVDEIHSTIWEFSTLRMDKEWYGTNSTYNAYNMIEWLDKFYDVDRIVGTSFENLSVPGAQKITPEIISDSINYSILKNYDILIVKTPSAYNAKEIEDIVKFVKEGGGLLLIGDHTNFLGTSTNLNEIATRFGIEFGFDSVNTFEGKLYHFERGLFPHPVLKYMPYLDFMTGSSIKTNLQADSIIRGSGLNAIPGEYSSSGFFRETRMDDLTQIVDTAWGLINQAVATNYGRGRVVAFPDSTIISNFRIFFGGTPNLIIGIIEYLNYSNKYENAKTTLFILGLILLILAIWFMRGDHIFDDKKLILITAIIACCSISSAISLMYFTTEVENSLPLNFYIKNDTVSFDEDHSAQIVGEIDRPGDYETFFVWIQRINLTPTIEKTLGEALNKSRIFVIIDPIKSFSFIERKELLDFIKSGNSVLLMANNSTDKVDDLLREFNMSTYTINFSPENKTEMYNETWRKTGKLPIDPWGLAIRGGNPLLSIDGRVVLAESKYGNGKFLIFSDSNIFKNGFFGEPGFMGYAQNPTMLNLSYNLRGIYDLEYNIFEEGLRANNNSSNKSNNNSIS